MLVPQTIFASKANIGSGFLLQSYGILHKLCHYPTIALRALLLLGYCHCNIFCSLIILYYNVILILLYFWNMWCTQSPLHHIHITFVTLITIFSYVGTAKSPILHQHICYICNFIIESWYVGAPKPHFCTTYKLNLLETQLQFN